MLVMTETYEDFDGNKRTEDFMFNLTEAELTEMEVSQDGGLSYYLEKIAKEVDGAKIVSFMKKFVLAAYGVKSPDGKHFIKSEEVRKDFETSAAYSQIFMKLATDADEAAKFFNGIIPKSLSERAKQIGLPNKTSLEVVKPNA